MITLHPFLKWPGGKRWLISRYKHILPSNYNSYIEPFLGGGSVFFYLRPERGILSDCNAELIETYEMMRDYPKDLEHKLYNHQRNHSKDYYYYVRKQKLRKPLNRASRFIYLNKTCFNGMYRVNKNGQFNVPKGSKDEFIQDLLLFPEYSELLMKAELRVADFEETLSYAKKEDLIFSDPPYTVNHNNNGFLKYNEKLFSWDDQLRLAKVLSKAKEKGAKIIGTNAGHHDLKELYEGYGFYTFEVLRYCSISGKGECRKQQKEIIITNILDLEVIR